MRILHALSQTELTGSEVYAWELCRSQERHHSVHVVSDRLHKHFPGQRLTMELSTDSFWVRLNNILKLRRYVREKQIDLVHCHSRGACRHLYWALWGLGIPMMSSLHGRQHASFSKRLFDIYGDFVIAICERIGEQLKRDFHMDPHKLEIIRNPVEPLDVPSALPLHPRVALMGRASGPKGQRLRELLRSQASVWLAKYPGLKIDLVLSGLTEPQRRELRRQLPEQVHIFGSVPSLTEIISRSTVVIGSGRIAIETLLGGRHLVALGEAECLGLMTKKNWSSALASNFGDVGESKPVNGAFVSEQVMLALQTPIDGELRTQAQKEYNRDAICERIEDLYRGLRLFKSAPWIPILMYHKVVKEPLPSAHRTFVIQENFDRHLRFYRRRGFSFLHFSELADFWNEKRPLREFPRRPLILTFDDGYRNNQELALPLLKKYKAKATIFALSDPKVTFNEWDVKEGEPKEDLMNFNELSSLPSQLIEIGSHGFRHERLTEKNDGDVFQELNGSRERLHQELRRPVGVFAYAYGDVDGRLPAIAAKAGYDFAVNTDTGPVLWIKNRWSLFRVNVFPEDNWMSLWKKTSPWYRRYYFRKRGR